MTHQRVDFAILSIEQIVNQAAKWHYMFGGLMRVPLVIRMIVGRGWGQGAQHSQSLQSWFAHVPGLKVIMPATPRDAKGMLIAAVEDDNPVIVLEHRWLYNLEGDVPLGHYSVPFGQARVARAGKDATIVAVSFMVIEALRAAEFLAEHGVEVEVIDVRSLRPLDDESILASVRKTGRLLVADTGWKTFGVSAEIVALAAERAWSDLKTAPARVALPECPTPTSPALANALYPRAIDMVEQISSMLGKSMPPMPPPTTPLDVPDPTFVGPF
jgi:pyruvate dehydrogenase E1 component beta subunit